MAQPDPRIKKLKIQTGVVKRITKEKTMYEQEADGIEAKIEKLKASMSTSEDEYVLRKQQEVLQESRQMVPDTLKRLRNAYDELNGLVESEKDLSESAEYKAAQAVLVPAKAMLEA